MENLVIGRRPNLYSDSESDDGYDSTDSEYSGPRDMSVVISDLEDLKQRMYDMMTKIDQLDQRKPPGMRSPTTKPEITASSLKLDNDEFGFNDIKFDNKKKPASVKAEVKPPVVPKVTKATKAPKVSKQPNTEKTTKAKTAKPPVKKETSAEKKARLKKHMEERAAARKQ